MGRAIRPSNTDLAWTAGARLRPGTVRGDYSTFAPNAKSVENRKAIPAKAGDGPSIREPARPTPKLTHSRSYDTLPGATSGGRTRLMTTTGAPEYT